MLVTLAVFVFMSAWNDFMWPLVVLTDSAKYTLPVGLANLSREHVQDTELMMAASGGHAAAGPAPLHLAAAILYPRHYMGRSRGEDEPT